MEFLILYFESHSSIHTVDEYYRRHKTVISLIKRLFASFTVFSYNSSRKLEILNYLLSLQEPGTLNFESKFIATQCSLLM